MSRRFRSAACPGGRRTADRLALSDGRSLRRHRRPGRSRRRLRHRAARQPRIRDEIAPRAGAAEERVSGPGATPVMAAFTHLNPGGSRFSDGSYGVYYAAHSLETAIAEVSHHRAIFLRRTASRDRHRPQAHHRQLEPSCTTCSKRHRRQRSTRFASILDPTTTVRRSRSAAPARGRQLGHPLPERAPRGRRVRRHPAAARAAPCQGCCPSGAALGRTRITHWYEKRQPHAFDD